MKTTNLTGRIAILAMVLAGFAHAAPKGTAKDNDEVMKLLTDTQTQALQLKADAQAMETYSYNEVSYQTQGVMINQIKDHINQAGKLLDKLRAQRDWAAPWQQKAVDRIAPLLEDMAGNTEMVIDHINGTNGRFNFKDYKELLETNADAAQELAATIGNFVDYGRTKRRFEELTNKTEQ